MTLPFIQDDLKKKDDLLLFIDFLIIEYFDNSFSHETPQIVNPISFYNTYFLCGKNVNQRNLGHRVIILPFIN